MRSKIATRIKESTPEDVKKSVRQYGDSVVRGDFNTHCLCGKRKPVDKHCWYCIYRYEKV